MLAGESMLHVGGDRCAKSCQYNVLQYKHVMDVKYDFETCCLQSKYFLRQGGWINFQSHTYLQGVYKLWATEVTVFCFALLKTGINHK